MPWVKDNKKGLNDKFFFKTNSSGSMGQLPFQELVNAVFPEYQKAEDFLQWLIRNNNLFRDSEYTPNQIYQVYFKLEEFNPKEDNGKAKHKEN